MVRDTGANTAPSDNPHISEMRVLFVPASYGIDANRHPSARTPEFKDRVVVKHEIKDLWGKIAHGAIPHDDFDVRLQGLLRHVRTPQDGGQNEDEGGKRNRANR